MSIKFIRNWEGFTSLLRSGSMLTEEATVLFLAFRCFFLACFLGFWRGVVTGDVAQIFPALLRPLLRAIAKKKKKIPAAVLTAN